ncbi:ATP-binding cassette domain-containing protein [Alphaproteobacteria bacterium HT1-32]|nr:ATP-binding cassette domain-containing protein [Alphaproteobacteria bacterium HT1-32]
MSVNSFFARDDWPQRLGITSAVRGSLLDLFFASITINILALALPLALLQVYDRILPNEAESTLLLLMLGIGAAVVLEGFLKLGRTYISGWAGAKFEHLAGVSAVERLLMTNLADFEQEGSGVHLERLGSLNTLKDFYSGQAFLTIWDVPFAILFLGLIAYLAGWLVAVPVVVLVVFVLFAVFFGKRLKKAVQERMTADDRRYNFIIEVLAGIHTVKSMAMESQMLRRYERLQESCAVADGAVAMDSTNSQSLGTVFSQLTTVAVVCGGALLVIDNQLTIGGLAACTMLAGRAMQPLQRAVGIYTRFQTILIARERLKDLWKLQPEVKAGMPKIGHIDGALELRDVEFRFGKDDEKPVLEGVNVRLKAGEAMGIAGDNGSGKTTLLWLMMGALRPTEGEVYVDGQDLRGFDPHSYRSQIAYLPQLGELFQGTIMDNITMFRGEEYEEAATATAELLGLDDVVSQLPMGYETRVGDGASDALPRGIKQRIAIARALVDQPRIVLFDEANTAIDGSGDNILREMLEKLKGHATMVLVTHRPSMLKLCDQVFDLKDGHLTERDISQDPMFQPAQPQQPQLPPQEQKNV